jgi:hypothetical protein
MDLERTTMQNATITEEAIEAIERGGDCAIRAGHTQTAIELYALALRLRGETGIHPQRRADDV